MNNQNKFSLSERRQISNLVFWMVNNLEVVQRMPLELRLAYYKHLYKAYSILRKNNMLGRRKGGFDQKTIAEIQILLSEFEEYGTTED